MPGARPKIIYFDLRGRAEPIRLALEDLGEAYDEDRVSAERWSAMKPATPFGVLPILEEGELRLPETLAIYQHIARTRDLYGRSETDRSACDVALSATNEAIGVVWGQFWRPDCEATLGAFMRDEIEPLLGRFQRWFRRDGRTAVHWAGESLTFADYFAFRFLDEIDAFFPQALARHGDLLAFWSAFSQRPGIAAYIASDRRPKAFGVGIDGPKLDMRPHPAAS